MEKKQSVSGGSHGGVKTTLLASGGISSLAAALEFQRPEEWN